MRKKVLAFVLAFAVSFTGMSFTRQTEVTKADDFYTGWKLQWSDEFDGNSLNTNVWNVEVNGYGGWNNELQYYTNRNHRVDNGTLKITAQHETYEGMNYTSTRINSQNKVALGNGRIEARIKLPIFKGTFPAFWLMGNNGQRWPECGEIDIMEAVNTENIAYGTAHWPKNVGTGSEDINSKGNGTYGWNLNLTEWHTYGIERDDNQIVWYVDGRTYHSLDLTSDAANKAPLKLDTYILLNLAIGGDWPGFDIDNSAFPATMEVDYVRYYVRDESVTQTTTQQQVTQPQVTQNPNGKDIIASYSGNWSSSVGSWANAAGTVTANSPSNGFTANLTAVGDNEWGAQASLPNIAYTPGHTYTFKCTLNSNIDKNVFIKFEGANNSEVVPADYVSLKANTPYVYTKTVTIPSGFTDPLTLFYFFSGGINGESLNANTAMTLNVTNVSMVDNAAEVTTQPETTTQQQTTQQQTTEQQTTKAPAEVKVDIDGYQISHINKGLRTTYTVVDEDSRVASSGLIYGYGNMNVNNMVVGSNNAYVHSYESTSKGLLPISLGTAGISKSYAMTMKYVNTSNYFSNRFYIRPYAKLKDGTYVYGELYSYTVFNVAEYLYKNKMMVNEEAHNFVYNNILKIVNPSYSEISYEWDNTVIN